MVISVKVVVIMPKLDVEISPLAFSKIIDWVSSNTEREIGGYLIGCIEKTNIDNLFQIISLLVLNMIFL